MQAVKCIMGRFYDSKSCVDIKYNIYADLIGINQTGCEPD